MLLHKNWETQPSTLIYSKSVSSSIDNMSGAIGMPDYRERPGTLTMRGDHMNYSRVVLNSNW